MDEEEVDKIMRARAEDDAKHVDALFELVHQSVDPWLAFYALVDNMLLRRLVRVAGNAGHKRCTQINSGITADYNMAAEFFQAEMKKRGVDMPPLNTGE